MAIGTIEPTAAGGAEPERGEVEGRSPWQLFWRRFRQDKLAFMGIGLIVIIGLAALLSPVVAHFVHRSPSDVYISLPGKPNCQVLGPPPYHIPQPKGPSHDFYFGCGKDSQDVFIKTLYGARTSLTVALMATGLALVVGVVLGLLAGFYRGKIDTLVSRFTDLVMSMPVLLLALGLGAACSLPPPGSQTAGCLGGIIKPGIPLVALIIGFFSWPYISRIVRGQVLSLREREFVEAARAVGATNRRIMFREILPNVVAPILVYTTLIIPNNILFEAALSFLGVGVPPETPSWGRMLSDASGQFTFAWWTMLFPGLFLFLTTLAFNLVGDGLRDALDPRTGR